MPTIIHGGGSKKLSGTATTAQVLNGATFSTDGRKLQTGTMTIRGAVTQTLNCGESYTVTQGYHNGSGKVTANTLASQTSGTAIASNILKDKTAWVGGAKITGTIASKTAQTYTPTTADQTIASGQYLSGAQTIKGDANLLATNILNGVSIFGVVGSVIANTAKVKTGTFYTDTYYEDDKDVYYKSVDVGFAPDGVALISLNEWTLSSLMDDNLLAMYIIPSSTTVKIVRLDSGNKVTVEESTESTYYQSIYAPSYRLGRTSTGFNAKFGTETVSGTVGESYARGDYWYIAWKN